MRFFLIWLLVLAAALGLIQLIGPFEPIWLYYIMCFGVGWFSVDITRWIDDRFDKPTKPDDEY